MRLLGMVLAVIVLAMDAPQAARPAGQVAQRYLSLEREVYLSAQQIEPLDIARASNGDFIVTGSIHGPEVGPWAARISADGKVRWEFMDALPSAESGQQGGAELQTFLHPVEFSDGTILLCGMKVYRDGYREVLLVHLKADGTLIRRRTLLPSIVKDPPTLSGCAKWNDGAAIVASFLNPDTGWIAKVDQNLGLVWEKAGKEYSGSVMEADAGRLFILNSFSLIPDPTRNTVSEIGPSAEIIARYQLPEDAAPRFVRSETPGANLRLVLLDVFRVQGPKANKILSFDARLSKPKQLADFENSYATTCLELRDGSIAVFGNAAGNLSAGWPLVLIHPDGVVQHFSLAPPNEHTLYSAATQTANAREFVGVRTVAARAVLDWVSF